MDSIPIFPLNTVLFPHMPLALHIFEPRYKQMVGDMGRGDRLCVSLIKDGVEVGGPAEPFDVACLARVLHLRELPGGEYHMVAVGVERVRITSVDAVSKPYLTGSVSLWPDVPGIIETDLAGKAAGMFVEYVDCLIELSGEKRPALTLPEEPENLSFVLATAMQITPQRRQQLLEKPGATERLRAEVEILKTEVPLLRALLQSPRPPEVGKGKFSAN